MRTATVAPITTTIPSFPGEVGVDRANGLTQPSVVSCDNVTTIPSAALGEQVREPPNS
ncbi:MAG: type II toxin-antitoxin system PemK/MazF family toxin [Solirubrobacterales bacterium]